MTENFDWSAVRVFLQAANTGSFTAAGEALGLSQPTVGRKVSALEAELGVVLFVRTGRTLELTEAGRRLCEHAVSMQEAATALSLAAAGQSSTAAGAVSISCSDLVAVAWLPELLVRLRRDYPAIEIEVITTNSISDLTRREADIAIRHVRPDQPDLVGRKLADTGAGMYASAAYLEELGPLGTLKDLQRAVFIAFDRSDVMLEMLRSMGVELTSAHFPLIAASSVLQRSLCRQGAGICFLFEPIGEADPALIRVQRELRLPVPLWLVCHRELRTTLRFRVVFDALVDHLTERSCPG